MRRSKLFFVELALLLTLTLTGSAAAADILPKLLANSGKIVTLNHIAEHGGRVYASGFLCKPEWNPVPGVNIYTGGFAVVGDAFIYKRPQGTGPFPTELYRSDLRGARETVITRDVDSYSDVWVVGDRIIYASMADKPDSGYVCTGVFWYDVNASKSTRLLNALSSDDFFSLVSFNDTYVYYRLSPSGGLRRVRWDGLDDEALKGVEFPVGLYKVEGKYYYCVSIDYSEDKTEVSRYSMDGGNLADSYIINASGLLAMKDGCVYFGNNAGVFKMDMNTGETVRLAALAPKVSGESFGFVFGGGVIVGNDLYFSACYNGQADAANSRLYKVPLNGGQMVYQNVEWFQS